MHIFSMKGMTKKEKIRQIKDAPVLYVPLLQQIGQAALPTVSVGEKVKKYQLIGQAHKGLSANIHAPVSGVVQAIEDYPLADGTAVPTLFIKNDFKETEEERTIFRWEELSPDEIIGLIREAGIVGEGGAQFPTSLKYTLDGKRIHTLIVNGTECEPYLTADYALMEQHTGELLEGIRIINKVLQAEQIVITLEEQNKELVKVFAPFLLENPLVRLQILPNEYPQGGELQLIQSVLGFELPRNQLPRDRGVLVNNVGTIYSVYQAVARRIPLVSRFITLSGEESLHYGNYEVKIGTPISHLLEELHLSTEGKILVLGGPMMGKFVEYPDASFVKGSSGLLLFRKQVVERQNCISCGYCVEVCPMHLMPMKFEEIYRTGKFFKLEKYQLSNCIECAACEYICPSNVPLIQSIKEGKKKIKELAHAIR